MAVAPVIAGASTYIVGQDAANGDPVVLKANGATGALKVEGASGGAIPVAASVLGYQDSVANLNAAAVFTGASRDRGASPSHFFVSLIAQSDKTGKLELQTCDDNSTWLTQAAATNAAGLPAMLVGVPLVCRYWRVRYTNSDAAATTALMVSSASYSS